MKNTPAEPEEIDTTEADDPPYFYDPADYPDVVQPDHHADAEASGHDANPDDYPQKFAAEEA